MTNIISEHDDEYIEPFIDPYISGIIPYIIIDKTQYFLLGLEKSRNNWSGFVGRCDKNELVINGTMRVFHEETAMIFEEYTPLIETQLRITRPIKDKSPSNKEVYIYVIKLPVDFQDKIKEFINKKATFNEDRFHHKSILKWFTLDEIKNSNKIFFKVKELFINHF